MDYLFFIVVIGKVLFLWWVFLVELSWIELSFFVIELLLGWILDGIEMNGHTCSRLDRTRLDLEDIGIGIGIGIYNSMGFAKIMKYWGATLWTHGRIGSAVAKVKECIFGAWEGVLVLVLVKVFSYADVCERVLVLLMSIRWDRIVGWDEFWFRCHLSCRKKIVRKMGRGNYCCLYCGFVV